MNRITLFLGLIILVFFANLSLAGIPKMINYQGMLTQSDGVTPVTDGLYSIRFSIWDDLTLGSELWNETQSVQVTNGLFNVNLGSITPLGLPFDKYYWLEIKVGVDPKLSPRTKLTSVGYAYRALRSDTASYAQTGGAADNAWVRGTPDSVLYTVHQLGIAKGGASNMLYGTLRHTHVNLGVSCTTGTSGQNWGYATVGGGYRNTASGYYSTVGGGNQNHASGNTATVSGGATNIANDYFSTVGGGSINETYAAYGGVFSGYSNQAGDQAYDTAATVAGGRNNKVTGRYGFVGGGLSNSVGAWQATVAGGDSNSATGTSAVVGGGHKNAASNQYAVVAGGTNNTASGPYATVAGGERNTASEYWATVGGGMDNTANGFQATVGGGRDNTASINYATVGGGYSNGATGWYATVGGGRDNTASGYYATVAGGEQNRASGTAATVAGGDSNTASGNSATVGGGYYDTASGSYATVGGGYSNTASGYGATVGGGAHNDVTGSYSVIPGGYGNILTASAQNSMAFGEFVYVNNPNRVIFFRGANNGRLGLNRDDHDGGISYPIHVGTNTANGNGAYLTAGGAWTNGSSRTFKENFQPLNSQELFEKISNLPVETWNFKNSEERHIGPVAEDFVLAFDVGTIREDGTRDNKYLASEDIAGVALAGVKELIKENKELKQVIEKLSQKIAELEKSR